MQKKKAAATATPDTTRNKFFIKIINVMFIMFIVIILPVAVAVVGGPEW